MYAKHSKLLVADATPSIACSLKDDERDDDPGAADAGCTGRLRSWWRKHGVQLMLMAVSTALIVLGIVLQVVLAGDTVSHAKYGLLVVLCCAAPGGAAWAVAAGCLQRDTMCRAGMSTMLCCAVLCSRVEAGCLLCCRLSWQKT